MQPRFSVLDLAPVREGGTIAEAFRNSVDLARHAGARSVLFFHHRPNRTDAELDAVQAGLSGEPRASVAVQGTRLDL